MRKKCLVCFYLLNLRMVVSLHPDCKLIASHNSVVEWVTALDYCAEGREFEPISRLKISICRPSSKRVSFFELGKDKGSKRKGIGSAFHMLCPSMTQWTPTATAPTTKRLREPLSFLKMTFVFEDINKAQQSL